MTTLTAVSSTEVIVNNNGRAVRVHVDKLLAIDEAIASHAQHATRNIGQTITVASKRDRRPRHATVHGLLQ
jgi:hypothetical protein